MNDDATACAQRLMQKASADMVFVPGGTFRMGSEKHYPEEAPAHRVTVDGFWIDRAPARSSRSAPKKSAPALSIRNALRVPVKWTLLGVASRHRCHHLAPH
jgi:hypothetical protein